VCSAAGRAFASAVLKARSFDCAQDRVVRVLSHAVFFRGLKPSMRLSTEVLSPMRFWIRLLQHECSGIAGGLAIDDGGYRVCPSTL
jgi:hypothetical protein